MGAERVQDDDQEALRSRESRMASTTQNQCPHPVPTNHTGCLKVLLQRVVILWGWFVLFETGFHYVFLAGLELIIYTKLASSPQRSIAISLPSTEIIGTSHHT